MEWIKKNKWKILIPIIIILVLVAAFWYGGNAPEMQGVRMAASAKKETTDSVDVQPPSLPEADLPNDKPQESEAAAETQKTGTESRPAAHEARVVQEMAKSTETLSGASSPNTERSSASQEAVLSPDTGKDKELTEPVPEGKPLPVEPENMTISDTVCTCTISISCASVLGHMDWLEPEKAELIPTDGWILMPTEVTFYEGESAFDVLQRTCKQRKIHMEFEDTPIYHSAYIEGISNLYEFDCGELSGWMFKVNDWFPNYGCSRYQLQDGDIVTWIYTCDLGRDIGAEITEN